MDVPFTDRVELGKSLLDVQLAGKVHPVFSFLHNNHFSQT